jgi:peptide/nickel transport system substrate-binding protein
LRASYITDILIPAKGVGVVEDGQSWLEPQVRLSRREVLRNALVVGGALSVPGVLAACGGDDDEQAVTGQGESGTTPSQGGRLRTAHVGGGNAETLSPLVLPNIIDVARASQLYDMLYFPDADLVPQPRLAESLEPNADASVWQLTLKSGIVFHDGKPFGADDVLYTWAFILDPKNEAEGRSTLEPLDIQATTKVSDTEIEVHLKRPIGDLPGLLSQRQLSIIPDGMTDFNQPNGTGPFKFVSWTQGDRSLFERNANYWGDGPYVDEVEILSIPDPTARVNALLGGQVDAIEQVDYTVASDLESNDSVQLIRTSSPSAPAMTIRMDVDPFTDSRVREAMRLAVDREQMLEVALLGYGSIGNDLIGKGFPSYNDELPQREYDPEKAMALLQEAGQSDLTVTLNTSRGVIAGLFESATAYAEQAKAAGINVKLEQIPPDSYFNPEDRYLSAQAPFYQTYWPISFEQHATDALLKDSPFRGETEWSKPGWEEKFRAAQGTADPDERNGLYKELQVDLYNEGGYIVWGFSDIVDAATADVQGVTPNPLFPLGYFQYKDWSLAA